MRLRQGLGHIVLGFGKMIIAGPLVAVFQQNGHGLLEEDLPFNVVGKARRPTVLAVNHDHLVSSKFRCKVQVVQTDARGRQVHDPVKGVLDARRCLIGQTA